MLRDVARFRHNLKVKRIAALVLSMWDALAVSNIDGWCLFKLCKGTSQLLYILETKNQQGMANIQAVSTKRGGYTDVEALHRYGNILNKLQIPQSITHTRVFFLHGTTGNHYKCTRGMKT